ncbi:MAG: glycosyltransferase family 4 protein [Gammaproteobacteria bacterium]
MKLVYFSASTIPSHAANSVHVMKMCQAFADNGHDVELLAPERGGVSESGAAVFSAYAVRQSFRLSRIRRSNRRWGSLSYAYNAARYAQRARPDMVYGRDIRACWLAALRGLSVILEVHDLNYIRRSLIDRFVFRALQHAKAFRYLVVISHALARDVVAMYPGLKGRVRVAHDGADPVANETSAAEPGLGRAALRVGYVGNIYPGRGVELLSAIARRLPWVELHIVGEWAYGVAGDPGTRSLPANVHVHGFLPYADAERVRMTCDVLLAPYQRQVYTRGGSNTARWMSPLKIFEYMAAGKAIVCSDIEVLHEVLEDRKTTLFCPPDDVDAWCAALTQLHEDEELRLRLGHAARATFSRLHTWRSRAALVLEDPVQAPCT